MATKTGAEFSPVRPLTDQGRIRVAGSASTGTITLGTNVDTLENGTIVQVSAFDAFRPGQQVLFWLTVYNGIFGQAPGTVYINRVRIKPWWLRPQNEFRAPGMNPGVGDVGFVAAPIPPPAPVFPIDPVPGWKVTDNQTFGGGTYANNRACWFPAVKMLDVSPFQAINPPPAAPVRQSDSVFLDDLWTLDLQDPNLAAAQALPLRPGDPLIGPDQQLIGRSCAFLYVSHGYALGLTHAFTFVGDGSPNLRIDLTWVTGTL